MAAVGVRDVVAIRLEWRLGEGPVQAGLAERVTADEHRSHRVGPNRGPRSPYFKPFIWILT